MKYWKFAHYNFLNLSCIFFEANFNINKRTGHSKVTENNKILIRRISSKTKKEMVLKKQLFIIYNGN